MADALTCPDCGARAIVGGDNLMTCQGPLDATPKAVRDAEKALQEAVKRGAPHHDADKRWRDLLAQRSCGKISIEKNGVWQVRGYIDEHSG